jgi:hypothetical protein
MAELQSRVSRKLAHVKDKVADCTRGSEKIKSAERLMAEPKGKGRQWLINHEPPSELALAKNS